MQHTNTSSMSGDSCYKSILLRSGHAVAHDEEGRAFERLGKRAGQNAQVQIWIPGQLSEFVVSGRGRECSARVLYFIEIWGRARGGSREESRTVRMRPGGKSNGESPFFETPIT